MSITSFPQNPLQAFTSLAAGGLQKSLERSGQSPTVGLIIKPLSGAPTLQLDRFRSYNFQSSILVPVDSFSFTFAAPDSAPLNQIIQEGDVVTLTANDVAVATGFIDQTEVQVGAESGESATISGRDVMGQLEDQDAVSFTSQQIYAVNVTVESGVKLLLDNTKITKVEFRDAPTGKYLLATDPGESKLSALLRFLEPLNLVPWTGPSGQLIIGKPNMAQPSLGTMILSREKRFSNVLEGRVVRSSTQIGNVIIPIWTGQESVVSRALPEQALYNLNPGPDRLRKQNYIVPKTVVVSAPNGTDPQGLSGINAITAAGAANLIQAYAKREIARMNIQEIQFHCSVQGHFNDQGIPYMPDTVYHVFFDRGGVDEDMYLFSVEWDMSDEEGQRTLLGFCRFGSIVSDVRAP